MHNLYQIQCIMYSRYKPKSKGLIIPIWSRLCDCSKGVPDPRSMISVLQTAVTSLYPISVLVSVVSTFYSQSCCLYDNEYVWVIQSDGQSDIYTIVHDAAIGIWE